jgi:hypothetical protein
LELVDVVHLISRRWNDKHHRKRISSSVRVHIVYDFLDSIRYRY